MRYKSSHTYIIDFDNHGISLRPLFDELELFQAGWPTVEATVGMGVINITHRDRRSAECSADMLLSRLRSFPWFKEKVV